MLKDRLSAIKAEPLSELIRKDLPEDPVWIGPAILPKNCKLIFGAQAATGKALEENEPVLTKTGWKAIKELRVGEELISTDGNPSFITGIFPQGDKELYKITFSDGRSVACCAEHLWFVGNSRGNWKNYKIFTTKELQNISELSRLYIPTSRIDAEIQPKPEQALPLDPWLLGILLGDGCFRTPYQVTFTTFDDAIAERVKTIVPLTSGKRGLYRIKDKGKTVSILKDLALFGKLSIDKHIPDIYKNSTAANRLALLQGLMDSDGTVDKNGTATIGVSSKTLALDIQYILRSLGFNAPMKERIPFYYKNNIRKYCHTTYRVSVLGPNAADTFWLSRKKDKVRTCGIARLTIKTIEKINTGKAVCISVSHPNSLYITRDFIITHNSMALLSMARALALGETPFDCPLFTVERPVKTLLIEHELKPYGLQQRVKKLFADIDPAQLEDKLYYVSGEPSVQFSTDPGFNTLVRLVNEVQPEVLMLDPIGKMHYYDENDNSGISRLMYQIDLLIRQGFDWGMSVVFSHHYGKPSEDPRASGGRDKLDPYNFRGAAKWKDDPDVKVTMQRMEILRTAHEAWRIKTRWLTRQGGQIPDIVFTVNKNDDMRVIFEKFIEPVRLKPIVPPENKSKEDDDTDETAKPVTSGKILTFAQPD